MHFLGTNFFDVLVALIVAIPATLAAVQSFLNSRRLNRHDKALSVNTQLTRDIKKIVNGKE